MRKVSMILVALLALATFSFAQTAIHDIQIVDNPAENDASSMVDQTVTIHGWITFEPMSAGGNKFFVADAPGAWNGIYIYTGNNEYNLGFGWEVEVTGVVAEYVSGGGEFGITQINASEGEVNVISEEVDWTDLPAACAYTVLEANVIAGGQATAEQYEGVLVQVDNPVCVSDDEGFGEWLAGDGADNNFKIDNPQDDVYGYVHTPAVDLNYEYIRGVLGYSYGDYKVTPEIAFDLRVTEDPNNAVYTPFAWFQQVRPMDMTVQEDDEGGLYTNDDSYASLVRYGDDWEDTTHVTLHGLVTMETGLSYAGAGVKYIMCDFDNCDPDGSTKPWNAVLSYDPDSTAFPTLYEGDEIIATGYIDEYETGPASMTEFWITQTVEVISADNPLPTPAVVPTADLRNPITAEQWGNVFVQCQNAVVRNNQLEYEMFTIDDDLNDDILGINVDDDSDGMDDYDVPPLGTTIESISGWFYHHYGSYDPDEENWAYKLCPLFPEDIIIGEGPPNILSARRAPAAPGPDEECVVTAEISDNSSVEFATLYWKHEADAEWSQIDMLNTEGIVWEATIPAQAEGADVWYYVLAADDNNTESTWPGIAGEDAVGYWAVSDLGIHEIQYTPFSSGRSPYDGSMVTVSGVITTSPAVNTVHGAYFMQLGNEADYNGLCMTIPIEIAAPEIGDQITITGTIDESGSEYEFKWNKNTKMIDVVVCTIDGNNVDFTTHAVTTAEVNADLESYESLMVQFSNLTITSTNRYDWTFVDDSGEEFILDDDFCEDIEFASYFGDIVNGSTINQVTGILTYSFGSWKIEPRDINDLGTLDVDDDFVNTIPAEFSLDQNYPNPFNPTTQISYSIANSSRVQVVIYNSLGQHVRTLIDCNQSAGSHTAYWNGLNKHGVQVTSGTYYLRLLSDGKQLVRQMTMLK